MIIKIVQDDCIELAIELTDENDVKVGVNPGDWLEFVSTVRTRKYDSDSDGMKGKTQIKKRAAANNNDRDYLIYINTAKYHIVPGSYGFELNLMRADGTKTALLSKENNELIVQRRDETDG